MLENWRSVQRRGLWVLYLPCMKRASRLVRDRLKGSLHGLFRLGQRARLDILPRHFYSSIPDVKELENTRGWRKAFSMVGVAGADFTSQLRFLEECCPPELKQRLARHRVHEQACDENGESGYGPVEADFLYSFIVTKRPPRVLQIGSGVSTAVILRAAQDSGYQPSIVCIDPVPTAYLVRMAEQKSITLLRQRAQDVPLGALTGLSRGDLFFVDSTHAVRPGSEVNFVILEALPRLPCGCFVHFHDIYFPYDYQPSVLHTLFFSAESTLLHAFLINNSRCALAASMSWLHHACPEEMRRILPNYDPEPLPEGLYASREPSRHFPSATYLTVS
jgi:hypothetical protein